ncbi:hypothetical protein GCM10027595_17630 [Corynebacterium nasicanis]
MFHGESRAAQWEFLAEVDDSIVLPTRNGSNGESRAALRCGIGFGHSGTCLTSI